MNLDELSKDLSEATKGFKQMQIALLGFCLLVTIAIILISIKTLNTEN